MAVSLPDLLDLQKIITSLFLLYPEIHYRLKYFPFSRYYRDHPEIITDAPFRVEPGKPIPILLLLKDADQFPVFMESLRIVLSSPTTETIQDFSLDEEITAKWWSRIFYVEPPHRGAWSVKTQIHYRRGSAHHSAEIDNFVNSTKKPMTVLCSSESLPHQDGWIYGDLHFHSNYTSDQIEFGAPLEATLEMSKAIGLKFFAVTDHSYDLDDEEHNYLKNDPSLPKWSRQHTEIHQLNARHENNFAILAGEEVSCANESGRIVHYLLLGQKKFVFGSADGAERWLHYDSENTIREVSDRSETLAIAAHPKDQVPLIYKICFNRGAWSDEDCRIASGLQILNGVDNVSFYEGLATWKKLLLEGKRIFIYAGNDAHGNFNRYRQISRPMLTILDVENYQQFGWARTAVNLGSRAITQENILSALKMGNCVITTGPWGNITITNENSGLFQIGETTRGKKLSLTLESRSSEEFGRITSIQLFQGKIADKENLILETGPHEYDAEIKADIIASSPSYIRAEIRSERGFCYTNPIWITPTPP